MSPHTLVSPRRATGAINDPIVANVLARAAETRNRERPRRAPTEPPIRLLSVDSQRVVLLGLAAVFGAARNVQVIAEATTAEEAVEQAAHLQPEVIVMDGELPGAAGVIATQRIKAESPTTRVIMLGTAFDPRICIAAIHAGVSGYLFKRTDPAHLVEAVEIVADGGYVFDDAITSGLTDWFRAGRPPHDPLERLSQQERRIVRLIAEGRTNRDIAETLGLSEYTVKTYVSAALRKLGMTSRAEAAAYIIRHEPPPPPPLA
jgi:DNA-binding NarL/FixJ family response regulator